MATSKALAENATKPTNGQAAEKITEQNVLPVLPPEKRMEEPFKVKPSIEDRFYKMDVLFSKREKWERLKESQDKLNKFDISNDKNNDRISLNDGNGNTFATSNPKVLAKVIVWLKEDLAEQLAETDREINL